MSFYDWYCDLPPASPQVWGEQTDVPESADWYNSSYIIAWGSQRAADAHAGRALLHRGALQGREDGGGDARLFRSRQAGRHLDAPQAGHRCGGGDGDGPRDPQGVLSSPTAARRSAYFDDYVRRYTDMPMLVMLKEHTLPDGEHDHWCPTATCALATSTASSARPTTRNGRRVAFDETARWCCPTARSASAGAPTAAPTRQVEPRRQGGAPRRRGQAEAVGAGRRERQSHEMVEGRLPVLRRHRPRQHFPTTTRSRASVNVLVRTVPVRICAGQGRRQARSAGRHGVRPAGGATTASPAACRRARRPRTTTTTRPTRRPGRSASPARRASS